MGVCGLRFGLFFVEKLLNEIAGDVERGAFQRKRADDGLQAEKGQVAYLNAGFPHMKFQVVHAAAQQGEVRGVDGGHGKEGKRHFADAALHVESGFQHLRHGGGQTRRLKPCEIAVDRKGEKNSPQQQKNRSRTGFAHIPS